MSLSSDTVWSKARLPGSLGREGARLEGSTGTLDGLPHAPRALGTGLGSVWLSETVGARILKKGRRVPGADSEKSGGQPALGRER